MEHKFNRNKMIVKHLESDSLKVEPFSHILLEELTDIKWDDIGTSEIRKTGETFIALPDENILCYKGLAGKKEHSVGFLITKNFEGNIEFFSINATVVRIIIRPNKRHKLKMLQEYAQTSTYNEN